MDNNYEAINLHSYEVIHSNSKKREDILHETPISDNICTCGHYLVADGLCFSGIALHAYDFNAELQSVSKLGKWLAGDPLIWLWGESPPIDI